MIIPINILDYQTQKMGGFPIAPPSDRKKYSLWIINFQEEELL